jgi:3-dehydroquinate synthetase
MKHGFAVASGIQLAALFSKEKGFLKAKECRRITDLLKNYDLLKKYKLPETKMKELVLHDKKKAGNDIYFVFIKGIGRPTVEKLKTDEVIGFYRGYKKI